MAPLTAGDYANFLRPTIDRERLPEEASIRDVALDEYRVMQAQLEHVQGELVDDYRRLIAELLADGSKDKFDLWNQSRTYGHAVDRLISSLGEWKGLVHLFEEYGRTPLTVHGAQCRVRVLQREMLNEVIQKGYADRPDLGRGAGRMYMSNVSTTDLVGLRQRLESLEQALNSASEEGEQLAEIHQGLQEIHDALQPQMAMRRAAMRRESGGRGGR